MDQRLRDLERRAQQGDPKDISTYLHALIHAGQYSIETTKILAWLRYPPALLLHPHIRGKHDYLTKNEGRSVLHAVVNRIFFPPYCAPRQGPPASPVSCAALQSVTSDLIENFQIHLRPATAELLNTIHLDIFQHRAIRILTESTRDSMSLDSPSINTINNRISAVCNEVIHSRCSEFFSLSPVDRSQLRFGAQDIREGLWWSGPRQYLLTYPNRSDIQLVEIEMRNNDLAIRTVHEPAAQYYPTLLRDIPADAIFSDLRPLKSIIPQLLPPSLRSS